MSDFVEGCGLQVEIGETFREAWVRDGKELFEGMKNILSKWQRTVHAKNMGWKLKKEGNKAMELKDGMKVSCEVLVYPVDKKLWVTIPEGMISVDHNGGMYICSNEAQASYNPGSRGGGYKYAEYLGRYRQFIRNVKLLEEVKEMKYKQGDILVKRGGLERKVLGVCGEVYFVSYENDFHIVGEPHLEAELDRYGYKLKIEVEEMTMEKVCKELGREIKIKKQ